MTAARYEHFPHAADVGLRGIGASPAEAFIGAALALTAVAVAPAAVRGETPVAVECHAAARDDLLYDWLNALIYEMATRRMLFGRFDVTIEGESLRATAWGERVDVARHQPAVEPKGATYTGLRVFQDERGWIAECVVDV